jgi:hypothetical protein
LHLDLNISVTLKGIFQDSMTSDPWLRMHLCNSLVWSISLVKVECSLPFKKRVTQHKIEMCLGNFERAWSKTITFSGCFQSDRHELPHFFSEKSAEGSVQAQKEQRRGNCKQESNSKDGLVYHEVWSLIVLITLVYIVIGHFGSQQNSFLRVWQS